MSVVAFDGETLATDRASWKNNVWSEVRKLFEVTVIHHDCLDRFRLWGFDGPFVWGACGDASEVPLILGWMNNGNPVPVTEEKDVSRGLLLCVPTGCIYSLTSLLTLEPFIEAPVADGGGHEIALGAMLAGADAVHAVEIVIARSAWAAGGVDHYTLDAKTKVSTF